jgi:hypothetical protein
MVDFGAAHEKSQVKNCALIHGGANNVDKLAIPFDAGLQRGEAADRTV